MDAHLEHWRSQGRSFDYLGFEVIYRREGTGAVLLLIHGHPFSSFEWHAIWPGALSRSTPSPTLDEPRAPLAYQSARFCLA
jgi:pimeloyl-ACP methyl ester carboxylesterase